LKILVIEDEPVLRQSVVAFLEGSGYLIEWAATYKEALDKIDYHEYDCIVLDLMLPDGSGLELLRILKEDRKGDGVIIVSAKGALDDKVRGIALGADDYLAKPFHLSELAVRIAAIIRRRYFNGQTVVTAGDIIIHVDAQVVTVKEISIDLTVTEFKLLLFFITNKNRILSKNAIAQHLWGDNMDIANNYDFIYSHVKNIRKKLSAAGNNEYIRSIYGVGYKMQV
jgi:DNA-binding response OmpR family regulator